MKKLFLVFGLSLMTFGTFANEIKKDKKDEKKQNLVDVCCRRGQTTSSGENVSVRACVPSTGDYQIDMGKACEKARTAVEKAIKELSDNP